MATAGIVLMLSASLLVFFWETGAREHFLYSQVAVMAESVEPGTTITGDMIVIKNVEKDATVENAITGGEAVIGKKSSHYIPKGSQLSESYFKDDSIILESGDYIFTIPIEWIITLPNSLRSGDIIYFYPVYIEDEDKSKEPGSVKNNSLIPKEEVEDYILESVVAYLKDSGNREVVTVSEEDRYDGSSKIATLEIIANLKDISYLQDLAENNYKFIILYKDSHG
jgi:hypothetical protein